MKTFITSNKFVYILLAVIMAAGICRFSYGFFVEKKGTHSDEEWSFGLANSYYEPYIYSSDDDQYMKNTNEWISGDVIKDYLTVQEGERFSFDSVYYNMSCDTHPPLYFFVLHFFSSFFVDQYIPAIGFFINLACYIVLSFFLYKLMKLITSSGFAGVLFVFFNTFTVGTLSMVIYIRMYMMSAMFAVILAYLSAKLYYLPDIRTKRSIYVKLGIITCLGALTHHFFLPYAFIVAAVLCICWMIKRQWRTFLHFGGCILLGVALSIAIFPATLDHMFGIKTFEYRDKGTYSVADSATNFYVSTADNTNQTSASESTANENSNSGFQINTDNIENYEWILFKYYYATLFQWMFLDTLGWSPVSPYSRGILLYLPIVLLILCFMLLACSFLFRKDAWYIRLKDNSKGALRKFPSTFATKLRSFNFLLFAMILSVFFIVFITNQNVNVYIMGVYSTRYLFIIYPIFNLLLYYIVYKIFLVSVKRTKVRSCLLVSFLACMLLINNYARTCHYFFSETKNTDLATSLSEDTDLLIVSSDLWYLTVYSPLTYNCNSLYYTGYSSLLNNQSELLSNDSNRSLYLILDTSRLFDTKEEQSEQNSDTDYSQIQDLTKNYRKDSDVTKEDIISEISSLSIASECTYVGQIVFFNLPMDVYKLR